MPKFRVMVLTLEQHIQEWHVEAEDEDKARANWMEGEFWDEEFEDTFTSEVDEVFDMEDED